MSDDPDRQNALLTDAQRRYLRDDDDISPEYARKLRGDIRERIRNSLLDFTLLMWRLEDRDREQVFGPLRETPEAGDGYEHQRTGQRVGTFEQAELLNGLHNALGFLYRATEDASLPFEQFLRTAIERSLPPDLACDVAVNIRVDCEDYPDVETAKAVMRKGGQLTDAEFRVLVEHPGVRASDVVEYSRRERGEGPGRVGLTEADVADAAKVVQERHRRQAVRASDSYVDSGGEMTDSLRELRAWIKKRGDDSAAQDEGRVRPNGQRRVDDALIYFDSYLMAGGDSTDSLKKVMAWDPFEGEDSPDTHP
jgi:hypothetical protein